MIVIVDYDIGNLASVKKAFDALQIKSIISSDENDIRNADAIVLPGVGAAGEGMKNLQERDLIRILVEESRKGKPLLGICLGMQLLFDWSAEGNTPCLGLLKGKVKRFTGNIKIPQIGWNAVETDIDNTLFSNIKNNSYFYFVNSYYCDPSDKKVVAGKTQYGKTFPSIIVKDNIVGVQFHPEKSGKDGSQLLRNIMELFSERKKIC